MHADEKNNFTLSRKDVDGGGVTLTLSGRLVVETTAKVSGKILTMEDQKRLAEETNKQLAA